MLKQLGDGKKIKNEVMYGTDETINVLCKMFFLSNYQSNLKVDGGIGNRYRQITHLFNLKIKKTILKNYNSNKTENQQDY